MENQEEYYCSRCNAIVEENETICKNCGAPLTEIVEENGWTRFKSKIISFLNKFKRYHRISYYLFLGPLIMLAVNIVLGLLGIAYYEILRDTVERLKLDYIFIYFSYLFGTAPYILPVFVFTHLYLNTTTRVKIIITVAVIIILFLSSICLLYFGLNAFGIILLSIILLEISFIKYSKKENSILIISIILFLGWFQFLSLGDLTIERVREDYNRISRPLKVINAKLDFISLPADFEKYEESISFLMFREKDTLQLNLFYNKTWTKSIPSRKWQLVDWSIDSVFTSNYFYPNHNQGFELRQESDSTQ